MPDSSQKDALKILQLILDHIQQYHNINPEEALRLIKTKEEINIPLSIFATSKLTILEALVKYLYETRKMRFCEIAKTLNRNSASIYGCYKKSKLKHPEELSLDIKKGNMPFSIFMNNKLTISEAFVNYLSQERKMRFIDIARLLHRDSRTIWSLANRALKKNEK